MIKYALPLTAILAAVLIVPFLLGGLVCALAAWNAGDAATGRPPEQPSHSDDGLSGQADRVEQPRRAVPGFPASFRPRA